MLNIVTVNNNGYAPHESVTNVIHALAEKHYKGPVAHYCFASSSAGLADGIAPLVPSVGPGWWGKIDVFGPHMPEGRFLYLDLDCLPVGDFTKLVDSYSGVFCGDEDPLHWGKNVFSDIDCSLGTALMMGEAHALPQVYHTFKALEPRIRHRFRRYGDQQYVSEVLSGQFDLIERLYPKTHGFYNYRRDITGKIPAKAKFINFHGEPKWWNLDDDFIREVTTV